MNEINYLARAMQMYIQIYTDIDHKKQNELQTKGKKNLETQSNHDKAKGNKLLKDRD